jgi:hypothetical protein
VKITPATLTVSQLFSSNNEQFVVPAYQRRYAWGYKQLAELFDDIRLLADSDTHLLGTVLFLAEEHKAGLNRVELVDGQQRITSICLLLHALRRRFEQTGDAKNAAEIAGYLSCEGLDRTSHPKLELGDLDRPDLAKVMSGEDLDKVINANLKSAYAWLSEWVDEQDDADLPVFYFKLKNNARIIRLDVGQAKDAYKLFETINNRGLRLSPTDIIKNFLLGHASKVGDDALEKVRKHWKHVIVALDRVDSDDFFRQFMAGILRRKVTSTKLIADFKEYYLKAVKEATVLAEYKHAMQNLEAQADSGHEGDDDESEVLAAEPDPVVATKPVSITAFAKNLRDAAEIYGKVVRCESESNKVRRHLVNLRRIRSFPSYTFLISLFQRQIDEKDLLRVLRMLEAFMLRRHICEYRTGELDDIFPKLVNVSDNNIVTEVRETLRAELPPDDLFREKFVSYDYRKTAERARYVLEQIEYRETGDTGEYTLNAPDELHLEHVIPQTIDTKKSVREFGDWETYLGAGSKAKHRQYINRIGNLTLLAEALNIRASNNPFKAKRREYKKSSIRITTGLASEYTQFRFKAVEKRSTKLAELAPGIWKL